MRTLPRNKSQKQKLFISACHDYYGKGKNEARANQIAIWMMGRRRGIKLTEEEKSAMWAIRENLKDTIYTESLS